MGGRCAEETFFDEITTGASNDIQRATKIAHQIVCEYGMTDLGNRTFGRNQENVFMGRDMYDHAKDYSESSAEKIDNKISSLLEDAYQSALGIIKTNKAKLVKIEAILIEKEVLDGEAFDTLLR